MPTTPSASHHHRTKGTHPVTPTAMGATKRAANSTGLAGFRPHARVLWSAGVEGPGALVPQPLTLRRVQGVPLDADEREQLSDLFDELGPDAPTLLTPWTTRDLAAHLVLREHDYLAGPGLVVPGPWADLAERRRKVLAGSDFAELVATIRSGPPPGFFRLGWVRRVPNLNEFYVHHEDVRRANGRLPRVNSPGMDEALWANVRRASWFLSRRLDAAGLEVQWSHAPRVVRARRGQPTARIAGLPGELLLYLFGRSSAAQVELTGPAVAVEAVRRAHFGM